MVIAKTHSLAHLQRLQSAEDSRMAKAFCDATCIKWISAIGNNRCRAVVCHGDTPCNVKLLQKYCSTMSTKKSKQHAKAFLDFFRAHRATRGNTDF